MRRFLILAISSAALAACAYAPTGAPSPAIGVAAAAVPAATPAAAFAPITAEAGAYALDLSHASLIFRVKHLGMSMYTARFNKFDAALTLDPADPAASRIELNIEAASIDAGLEAARPGQGAKWNAELAQALGGGTITFRSTAATRTAEAAGQITGDLTMNGRTLPVTLDVTFYGSRTHPFTQKPMVGFAARGVIDRRRWGVANWGAAVGSDVEIVFEGEFLKS